MSTAAHRSIPIVAILLTACGVRIDDGSQVDSAATPAVTVTGAIAPQSIPPDTTTVAILTRVCLDSTDEKRAIASCSHGRARRVSDTLFVKGSTREGKYINEGGEAPTGFRYFGTLGDTAFDLVQSYGGEAYPELLFVPRAGKGATTQSWPVFSPDGRRMASGGEGFDNCAEGGNAAIQIWRFTATAPDEELHLQTQDCRNEDASWGAVNLRWQGGDTLLFTRVTLRQTGGKPSRTARAIRTGRTWRIEVDSAGEP
jgi:hypothetical protein